MGLLPLLCAAAFVAGCGGGGGSRSATQDVGVKPGRVCNAALLRRRLAAHPPRIGYLLRNTDVDNFTGRTPIECNTRQFVYWGAPPAVPGGDQLEVYVRVLFADSPTAARSLATAIPAGVTRATVHGTPVALYTGRGIVGARFVRGALVTTVTVGCVAATGGLAPASCKRPTPPSAKLRATTLRAVARLEPQLLPSS